MLIVDFHNSVALATTTLFSLILILDVTPHGQKLTSTRGGIILMKLFQLTIPNEQHGKVRMCSLYLSQCHSRHHHHHHYEPLAVTVKSVKISKYPDEEL